MDRRTDNAVGIQRSNERFFSRDSLLRVGEEPALGSHLVTARTLYSHHGIYVGNGRVIHYAGPSHGLCRGPVEDVSLEYFAHGRGIRVRHDRPRFDRREVVARARSRLGERSYRILTNNCEHFCEWCLNGASRSSQVERWLSGARRFACALLGTLGLAAGTPTFADPASQLAAGFPAAVHVRVEGSGHYIQRDRPDVVLTPRASLRDAAERCAGRGTRTARRPVDIQRAGKSMDMKEVTGADGAASIRLPDRITAYTAAPIWQSALDTLARNPHRPIIVDASRLEYVDNVGTALLFDLIRRDRPAHSQVEVRNLAVNVAALVRDFEPGDFVAPPPGRRPPGILEHLGQATAQQIAYAKQMVGFLRACAGAFRQALTRRGTVNWGDVLDIATEAGANAVPIVLLTGFLMGVIIAFEIGLVAQNFGAVIFVVDGVGIAMLRELGVLMTAIVFAGRTGAAFAAQIGTQKVNEEVNAIATFGLDPVHFLVLPRLLAAMLVLPLLTVLADLIGLFGGALVMVTFDVGFLQFYNQLLGAVTAGDFMLGIVKAAVFGLMIAAVGCHRGLTTGAGATSVGLSATSAVVTSIVLIVVIDGLFAVFTS